MKKIFTTLFFCLLALSMLAQSNPPRLIIREDDMGFSHSGNEALIRCYKEGIATSVEVLVASPWFPEAVKLLKQNPGLDPGIHLDLTSEWETIKWRPLTLASSLRDSNGYFRPMVFPNKNYPGQSISENMWSLTDIEKEFRAQIELAIKMIPGISHISAHMGCTFLNDSVRALTKKLANEYKLTADLDYPKDFVTYDGPSKTPADKIQSFIKMLDKLEDGKTYVFLDHPGMDGAELQAIYHIGYENVASDRQGVTDLFTSERVKAAIKVKGIKIIAYKDLPK